MNLDKEILRVTIGGDIHIVYDISEGKLNNHVPNDLHKLEWVKDDDGNMVYEQLGILIKEIKQL